MKLNVNKHYNITCVIASLGSEKLFKTVESLLSGKIIPIEIVICIPSGKDIKISKNYKCKITVLNEEKGQVLQRIRAIKSVKTEIIFQIDDDIEIDKYCLDILISRLLKLGPGNVVAANLIESENSKNISPSFNHKCGKVTYFGEAITLKKCCLSKDIVSTDWVPGGCSLYYLKDAIIENYYPFKGKAFNEDIICSLLRKKRGINHFIVPSAKCYLVNHDNTLKVSDLKKYYLSKKYYFKLKNKRNILFDIYFTKICIGTIFKNFLKFIKII